MNSLLSCRGIGTTSKLLIVLESSKCSFSQLKNNLTLEQTSAKQAGDDQVDKFVTNLITNKSDRWHNKKLRIRTLPPKDELKGPSIVAAINTKIVKEEDNLFKEKIYPLSVLQSAVFNEFDDDQILKILESPEILSKVKPELLMSLAQTFVKREFIDGILQLEATSLLLPVPLTCNFVGLQFESYRNSQQSSKALQLMERFYVNFPNSRREARTYMATIIRDVVSNHSEAVLVQCKHLAMSLENNFRDSRPLIYLWHACFSSEWFSDQQLAKEILAYISKNKKLVETFDKKLMTATYSALGRHRPELVQNLIEDLIANHLGSRLTVPMRLLFDYRCKNYIQ
jgi:hypothetical protein